MSDLNETLTEQLERTHREVRGAEPGRQVVLRRRYRADIDDVWDAVTNAERISRWFLPISGDLHVGGKYQFEGNAGGEILECEPPRLVRATWAYGEGDPSEVAVTLSSTDEDETELELVHTAVVDPEFWSRFGPGAVGVGWDLGLIGLAQHLGGGDIDETRRQALALSPAIRDFMARSSTAWGAALQATGVAADEVATAVENTTQFYAPDPPPSS
jgi:uncharacterized protein YndB with AHSA1/START domain